MFNCKGLHSSYYYTLSYFPNIKLSTDEETHRRHIYNGGKITCTKGNNGTATQPLRKKLAQTRDSLTTIFPITSCVLML